MTTNPASVPNRQTHPASTAPVSKGLGRVLKNLIVPVLILIGGGLLWGYVGGGWNQDRREALPPETKAARPDSTLLMVTVEPVTFRPVPRVVEAVGTLFGFEELVISAKVACCICITKSRIGLHLTKYSWSSTLPIVA